MKLTLWNVWKNNFYVRTVTVERLIKLRQEFFEEMEKAGKESGSQLSYVVKAPYVCGARDSQAVDRSGSHWLRERIGHLAPQLAAFARSHQPGLFRGGHARRTIRSLRPGEPDLYLSRRQRPTRDAAHRSAVARGKCGQAAGRRSPRSGACLGV